MRILKKIDGDWLRRYPDPECKKLRAAIARLHKCSPDQVFVGNGSDEILALCTRAFVEDGQTIAFFEPSYSLYPVLASIRKVRTKVFRLDRNFTARLPECCNAALFYITNPNAPTGFLFPKKEIACFCRRFKGVVILDEAYIDFANFHCAGLALKLKNTLVVRSLSKAYSLAGLRIGYAVGSRQLIAALFKIKDSYNVDRLAQRLAEAAIRDGKYLRANIRRIIAARKRLSKALQKMNFMVYPSGANFIWVKPPRISTAALYRALRQRGILVRYFKGAMTGKHLRITIGTAKQMNILLKAVREILD
jgi:histidinol-phosphate aminotransferase